MIYTLESVYFIKRNEYYDVRLTRLLEISRLESERESVKWGRARTVYSGSERTDQITEVLSVDVYVCICVWLKRPLYSGRQMIYAQIVTR